MEKAQVLCLCVQVILCKCVCLGAAERPLGCVLDKFPALPRLSGSTETETSETYGAPMVTFEKNKQGMATR